MKLRLIASLVFVFLLLSFLEAWAGFWLAGRWFISSRYASLTLAAVKSWLDRGIISGSIQTAKIFIRKNGKWILLTLGLSQVISEVQNLQAGLNYCYLPSGSVGAGWTSWGSLTVHHSGNNPRDFYTFQYSSPCYSGYSYIPAVEIRRWVKPWYSNTYQWVGWATVPAPGTHQIGGCSVTFSLRNVGSVCPSDIYQGPSIDWQQRRQVPVRVFPNPADFIRSDVINSDPALSYLRDEYNRIAGDSSIPTIPSDALSGVELPSVDWSIPEEEAVDSSATSSRESEGSQEGEGQVSVPGLDTKLDPVQRKPFPVELINQLVQNHPLLRVLGSVGLDVGGGGSCVMGSEPFIIDMCGWQWVLNLMGSFLVPLAFLFGLGIGGRSEG